MLTNGEVGGTLAWGMSKLFWSRGERKAWYPLRSCPPPVWFLCQILLCTLRCLTPPSAHQSEGQIIGSPWHQHHLLPPTARLKGKVPVEAGKDAPPHQPAPMGWPKQAPTWLWVPWKCGHFASSSITPKNQMETGHLSRVTKLSDIPPSFLPSIYCLSMAYLLCARPCAKC